MNSCKDGEYQPQDCDLIFQLAEGTDFSKAITDATAQQDEFKFDHVGMIVIEDGVPYVLEASSKKGVSLVAFQDFTRKLHEGYVIKRVKFPLSCEQIIKEAKSHLGEPYDWSFLPNNGKMYCSELIYEAYRNEQGTPIFHANPMNFLDKEGKFPQFWIDLFKNLKEEIPQGVMGTNPTDLSKEEILEEKFRCLPSATEE